jgi:hypothetical protein
LRPLYKLSVILYREKAILSKQNYAYCNKSSSTLNPIACAIVESRDGRNSLKAWDLFSEDEIIFLGLLCKKLKEKTEKKSLCQKKYGMGFMDYRKNEWLE